LPVVVEVSGLSKSFQTGWRGRPKVAVQGVQIEMSAGESLAIIGPNGAGKSTLLLLLAKIRHPTSGSFNITGSIGIVPERPALYGRLDPRRCLQLYGAMHGLGADQITARTADLFARLSLGPYADVPIRTLSTGWRQRVALAQALLHLPDVLLLDEPLGGLDPESSQQILEVLGAERERGVTLIVATHRLADFAMIGDRVALMSAGELRNLGPMDAVLSHLPVRITFTLPASATPPPRVAFVPGPLSACTVSAGQREAVLAHIHDQGGSVIRVEPDIASLSEKSAGLEAALA
jgi:ABC-2 type transport system ATP-binding protein